MNDRKIVDSFTIGGIAGHPAMPGERLQRMIGTRIGINIATHELYVPTAHGMVIARKGDRVILYDDDSLEVTQ